MVNEAVSLELLGQQINAMQERLRSVGQPSGPSDGGDGMQVRLAKLEASVEHAQKDITDIKSDIRSVRDNMRSDFRQLFGAVIAVALGLAGIMAKGFHWL